MFPRVACTLHLLLAVTAALPAADPPAAVAKAGQLEPIRYNHPGLSVDLGVGLWAWPLPMDYDRDGDLDLVVSCPDKPYNGTYVFENPGALSVEGRALSDQPSAVSGPQAESKGQPSGSAASVAGGLAAGITQHSTLNTQLIFQAAERVANGPTNVQVSYIDGEPVVMTPARIYADFRTDRYARPIKLPLPEKLDPQYMRYRANQWKLLDWEGDGDLDVIAGIEIWDDYGWDDAWDAEGNWKNGPLHGWVYLVENVTESRESSVESPEQSRDREGTRGEDRGSGIEDAGADPKPSTTTPRLPLADRLAALAGAGFAAPRKLTTTDGNPIDVYGMPSPSFADFDGDGDLDLICGEFLDRFTWFENTGTDAAKAFAPGRRLVDPVAFATADSAIPPLHMDLQMITPVAIDWDADGRTDLVCGDEDGRVALIRNRGEAVPGDLGPAFDPPAYFQQQAADVKFGALATPFSMDWNRDGDDDIVCGNTAGEIGFIENLGGNPPVWAAAVPVVADAAAHHAPRRAGPKGSIQGPCEAKWGYTTLTLADWDVQPGIDLIVNDIWGRPVWYAFEGMRPRGGSIPLAGGGLRTVRFNTPLLSAPQSITLQGQPAVNKPQWTWWTPEHGELATQWRTTPCAVDWNADGLTDLVMLDPDGYLAFYERSRVPSTADRDSKTAADPPESALHTPHSTLDSGLQLLPAQRVFKIAGPCEFDQKHKPVGDKQDGLLRLNANRAGASGRRKLHFVDWDGDGRLDLLVNSVNVNWLKNVRTDDEGCTWFEDRGPLDDRVLAGHDTAPASVDWDQNGIPDLLVGAEDGRLYFKANPRTVPTEIEKQRLMRTKDGTTVSTDQ